MPGPLKILALALGLAAPSACQAPDMAQQALVTGSITYRERIALPPSAIAQVLLHDASASDALSAPIAVWQKEIGSVPARFELPYDPARILDGRDYALSARILDGDRLLFVTDRLFAVLTHGNPDRVDMVLRRVGERERSSSLGK